MSPDRSPIQPNPKQVDILRLFPLTRSVVIGRWVQSGNTTFAPQIENGDKNAVEMGRGRRFGWLGRN